MICLAIFTTACENAETKNSNEATTGAMSKDTIHASLPPLIDYMGCLPEETALVAAHRGTAENTIYPENSLSALKALLEKGYLVSEVDVAGLKDGVHILYHDGVWDEKSTGKGPIASSTWSDAEKILLEDTNGNLSADRPVKFEDYLLAAKGKIYLEIDFKSSSKYETIIDLIRKHNMTEQVLLISYNEGQTKKLIRLAPDMMLSVGSNEALGQTRFEPNQIAAWIGYNTHNLELVKNLRDKNIPILGRIRKNWDISAANVADLLVSDDIFDVAPIAGLNKKNKVVLEDCLANL